MDAATADQEVAPYLWEQVSGSVTSPVELEQIQGGGPSVFANLRGVVLLGLLPVNSGGGE